MGSMTRKKKILLWFLVAVPIVPLWIALTIAAWRTLYDIARLNFQDTGLWWIF